MGFKPCKISGLDDLKERMSAYSIAEAQYIYITSVPKISYEQLDACVLLVSGQFHETPLDQTQSPIR